MGAIIAVYPTVNGAFANNSVLYYHFLNNWLLIVVYSLKESDHGCHIGDMYVGIILYADDIMLLSASLNSLQNMLNTCVACGSDLDIIFNGNKSFFVFKIGPNFNSEWANLFIGK